MVNVYHFLGFFNNLISKICIIKNVFAILKNKSTKNYLFLMLLQIPNYFSFCSLPNFKASELNINYQIPLHKQTIFTNFFHINTCLLQNQQEHNLSMFLPQVFMYLCFYLFYLCTCVQIFQNNQMEGTDFPVILRKRELLGKNKATRIHNIIKLNCH